MEDKDVERIIGCRLDEWRCGRVTYQGSPRLGILPATCGEPVAWIPYIHIRRSSDSQEGDAHAVMGAHAMCNSCRLAFRLKMLDDLPMWHSILSGLKAEGYPPPRPREIEVEWLTVEDFLKQVSPF